MATKADFSALRHRKPQNSVRQTQFCVNFMRFPQGKPDICAFAGRYAPDFLALPPLLGMKKAAQMGGFHVCAWVIQRLNQPFTLGPVVGAV